MTERLKTLVEYTLACRANISSRKKAELKQRTFSQDPHVACHNYWSFRITGTVDDEYWGDRITGVLPDVPVTGEWALEFHDRGGYRTGFICKQKRMDTGEWLVTSDIHCTRHFVKWVHKHIRSMWSE